MLLKAILKAILISKGLLFPLNKMNLFRLWLLHPKGQIISKQICGVLKFSKKATKYCQDFCPSL